MRYRLDAGDRLSAVDEDWLPFAIENGAPSLTPEAVLGASLYSFISDTTTAHLWKLLIARVRAGSLLDLNVRCDSPTRIRLLRLRACAEPGGGVTLSSDVLEVRDRVAVPMPPARSRTGPLMLCSWCQRIRLRDSEWLGLEEGIARLELFGSGSSDLISHGVCPDCFASALAEVAEQPASL